MAHPPVLESPDGGVCFFFEKAELLAGVDDWENVDYPDDPSGDKNVNFIRVELQQPGQCMVSYHPILDGTSCDRNRQYLPLNSLPTLRPRQLPDDFSPYETLKINELPGIIATLYNEDPPFSSHKHLYSTIDVMIHGDVPRKSFSVKYSGAIPDNPPSWMMAEYDVWFHDPKIVLEHQLANPNFDGKINYAAKVVINEHGCSHTPKVL
ncbi:hypothetical protein F5J12DRAFT_894591 [Pisolithus orientalis]|uniref:uncharacterized protein n=1 Tax=Pisolithus orientalis TaxID=936130 RepID=UPI0022243562|nr:uncharacterized protein F5J12DRAFT_894591 [Pisolithus orientalis]KAI6000960.1 hypothetical protein F5J12DRAFT_894591 [Pisolithus orientalis]